jgi:hypothetical protein
VQRIWLTVAAKYCAASQPDNKQQNKFMFSAGCFHGLVSRFGKTEKAGHTWLFTTKSSGSNLKPRAVPTLFPYFSPAPQFPIMDLHFESGPGSLADDDNGGSEIICMLGCLLLIFCTIFSPAAIITHETKRAPPTHSRRGKTINVLAASRANLHLTVCNCYAASLSISLASSTPHFFVHSELQKAKAAGGQNTPLLFLCEFHSVPV